MRTLDWQQTVLLTHFFPLSSGTSPARTAATPDAPPPSTTAFSISMSLRMEMAIHSSDTVTILSTRGAAVARALDPTVGTAKPSAKVGAVLVFTGLPAFSASVKLGHNSASTPCTHHELLTASFVNAARLFSRSISTFSTIQHKVNSRLF